jgi:hypothetical protein
MIMPAEFDYTMLSTFLTCRKKYWWRMVRNLILKTPQTALEFGRCIHLALDNWYVNKDYKKAIEVFNEAFVENPEDNKRTKSVAAKLLQLYHERYVDSSIKILASEMEFTLPIPDSGIALIGRIDKVIDWGGAIYVMDHKTTSRLGAEFFNKIKPNMQFDGYVWAARQLGYPTCSGVVMDALLVAKGLIIPAQLAKLSPLGRDISERTDEDIEGYLNNVRRIVRDIGQCYIHDEWYENTESCCDFNECPYRRLCKESGSVRESIVKADYVVEKWEPRKDV